MSDDRPASRGRRQVRQHLDALRAAGIEYVPAPPPRSRRVAAESLESTGTAHPPIDGVKATTLFDTGGIAPEPAEARRQALELMAAEVAKCDRCPELFATRTQTVFGVGPVGPEICFVGEAPGADEDRLGEPFVGAAGQLFNKIIAAMGLRRDEVYICNTLKCRPPNNRTPSPQECANCRNYFERQIELVKPKYICCLGGVAAQNVLNTKTGVTKLRGRFHEYRGIPVICTFHPAALLRNPAWKKDTWEDMKTLLRALNRPIPTSPTK